ncbi:MAG: phosphate acyltransferase PlsX [Syntrophaceticus sp.]|jgi:glycerol-3-phosphate acyltransferase PlsX
MKIAVDAMGGDYAPQEIVKGAVDAANSDGIEVILVGSEKTVREELKKYSYPGELISVAHASEIIGMDEHPARSVRRKKDASLVIAARLVKSGQAAAFVSAGNTGAQMAASLFEIKRIPGIERPGIATVLPSPGGQPRVLIDSGANADTKVQQLVQFAYLGSVFAESVLMRENPQVGLLNVGSESSKGSEMVVEAYKTLQAAENINFIGNIEGRQLLTADVDVIVCDGFVGNITLKAVEGVAAALMTMMKEELTKNLLRSIGGILVKPGIKDIIKIMDYSEYGGAPLLGVNGISVICHGSSRARAIKNAIYYAYRAVQNDLLGRMREGLGVRN